MADNAPAGGDLQDDLRRATPRQSFFNAKNLIIMGLILVGAFLAYVIFVKPKTTTDTSTSSTDTGTVQVTNDPSAVGSLETSVQSLQQAAATQTAGIQSIEATQATQGAAINNAVSQAGNARTNSSVAVNLLRGLNGDGTKKNAPPKPAPKAAAKPTPKPVPAVKEPPKPAGKGSSTNIPSSDVLHIMSSGLGL